MNICKIPSHFYCVFSSVLLRLSTENNFNHWVRLLMQVALFCVFGKTRTTLPTLEPTKSYKPRRNVWQADRQEDRQTYVSFKQHIELKKTTGARIPGHDYSCKLYSCALLFAELNRGRQWFWFDGLFVFNFVCPPKCSRECVALVHIVCVRMLGLRNNPVRNLSTLFKLWLYLIF